MRIWDAPTEVFGVVKATPEKSRIAFIDIGRTVAALVVFYTHVANQFVAARYGGSAVTDGFTALFETPLNLSSEGIGQISIYFFFLVSGFVVTPIALQLGARRFGVNRFFRIYPMNVLAVLLAAGGIALGLSVLSAGHKQDITPGTLVANLTLANFSLKPFWAMVGVAWTLAVEVLFYLLLIAMLPLLRRWVWAAIFVELDIVLILVLLRTPLGEDFGGFASQSAYLLLPIMGQIIWAGWHGKIHPWLAGGYLLAAWGLFVMATNLRLDTDYLLRPAPIVFAVLVFLVGLGAEPRLKQRAFWTAMSERSYSLYLMHGLIALPLMHAVSDALPVWLCVVLGVAATFAVTELAYRYVERPSHNLGRRLSRRNEDSPAAPRPRLGALLKRKRRSADDSSEAEEDEEDDEQDADGAEEEDAPSPDEELTRPSMPAAPRRAAAEARTMHRGRPAPEVRQRRLPAEEPERGDDHREVPARNGRPPRPAGERSERQASNGQPRRPAANGRRAAHGPGDRPPTRPAPGGPRERPAPRWPGETPEQSQASRPIRRERGVLPEPRRQPPPRPRHRREEPPNGHRTANGRVHHDEPVWPVAGNEAAPRRSAGNGDARSRRNGPAPSPDTRNRPVGESAGSNGRRAPLGSPDRRGAGPRGADRPHAR